MSTANAKFFQIPDGYYDIFAGKTNAEIAQDLCENKGLNVIPLHGPGEFVIRDGKKVPANKIPIGKWQERQNHPYTPEEIAEIWEKYPNANIGIICGWFVVVVDCDSEAAYRLARTLFVFTPLRVRTGRCWHLYYLLPAGDITWLKEERRKHKQARDGIDIQIQGQYVVGPGSIHESGAKYTMIQPVGVDVWEECLVPEIALQQPQVPELPQGMDVDLTIPHGNRNCTISSMVGTWLNEGVVDTNDLIHKALEFNKEYCNPPLSNAEIKKTVESVRSTVLRKLLFAQRATSHGSENVTEMQTQTDGDNVASDFDGLQVSSISERQYTPWDSNILHPTGLLGKIAQYIFESSITTNEIYCLAGAISVLGAVAGFIVQTPTGLTTKFYNIAVGSSGSGKDSPRSAIETILMNKDYPLLNQIYGGSKIASGPALLQYIARERCQRTIFVLDEIGNLLQATKKLNSPTGEIPTILTELYTSQTGAIKKVYKNQEMDAATPWSCLSLFGTSVPTSFYDSLGGNETANGFLARLSIFESREKSIKKDVKFFNEGIKRTVPTDIMEDLNVILEYGERKIRERDQGSTIEINTKNNHAVPVIKMPAPVIVPLEESVIERIAVVDKTIEKEIDAVVATPKGEIIASIKNRTIAKMVSLALLHMVSDHPRDFENQKITDGDFEWAEKLQSELDNRLIERINETVAETDAERSMQRVENAIKAFVIKERRENKENPLGGMPRALLIKNAHMTTFELDKIIDTMVQADKVRIKQIKLPNKRKRSRVYVLTEEKQLDKNIE